MGKIINFIYETTLPKPETKMQTVTMAVLRRKMIEKSKSLATQWAFHPWDLKPFCGQKQQKQKKLFLFSPAEAQMSNK